MVDNNNLKQKNRTKKKLFFFFFNNKNEFFKTIINSSPFHLQKGWNQGKNRNSWGGITRQVSPLVLQIVLYNKDHWTLDCK